MEKVDSVIVGAGVVGLAIAEKLADGKREIVVVEKHDGFGRETSSRNSEVIHAGFYYPEHSAKARLCVAGNQAMYQLCAEKNIPHSKCTKILVARDQLEEEKLGKLLSQGKKNGVKGMRMLSQKEVRAWEPHVEARVGLFSPESGIVDTHHLMHYFEKSAESHGATIAYNCEVIGLARTGTGYTVLVHDADGQQVEIETEQVINAAGLGSDKIAQMAGIDIDDAGYRLHPCKGEYFRVSNKHKGKLSRLVYPAPTPISLGVHAVLGLDGSLKFGPSAFYVEVLDYDVDPENARSFYEQAKPFFPFLEETDLQADMSGIRPKLQSEHDVFKDFVIAEESARGLPGLVNLIGIESPGLTSAPALAEFVMNMIEGREANVGGSTDTALDRAVHGRD